MKKAPKIENEAERLAALRKYEILDTEKDPYLDEVVELASEICETPMCLISLVDSERQWFKASVGFEGSETARDISFCGHAINQNETFIIENTLEDERFSDNPFVIEEPHLRFYAGAPLCTPDGHNIGTLCVLDTNPKTLNELQIRSLKMLANTVIHHCELKIKHQNLLTYQELQRKKAEELILQRQFLSETINNAPSVFYARTADDDLLMINKKFEHIYNVQSSDVAGRDIYKCLPESLASIHARDKEVLKTGKVIESEDEIVSADGKTMIFNSLRFPYYNSNHEVYATGCISIDITNRKVLEAQAVHKAKLVSIGEMAAGAGHEINNPLSIIIGYTSKLQSLQRKQKLTDATLTDVLEKINQSAFRISNIVSGIKSFSRYESEGEADFDIIESIKESVQMVQNIKESDGVSIEFLNNLANNKYYVKGHRGQIQQVLINLINNAVDSTTQCLSPKIDISCELEVENILIQVADNGSGIPEDVRARIFDPFFTTKPINKGTGIGLSLVNKIVNDHNGTIQLESEVGRGTIFQIRIPFHESVFSEGSSHSEDAHLTLVAPGPQKVLLVDDEPEIRELLSENLSLCGYHVISVENGKKAIEVYKERGDEFDLVICDVRMPEMNGYQVFQEIQKMTTKKHQKFVFITGGVNIDLSLPMSQIEDKVDGFLYKPFDQAKLYSLLNNIFAA